MRALTGLAKAGVGVQAIQNNDGKGKPLQIFLADILPDPANPRNADDENIPAAIEAQEQLNVDVAERGVKTPISIRPHPTSTGKYIINYGHRRYKAASANRLPTIPAFVDEKFDSYDQVNENELRTGLTTRSRALFIKSRLEAGDTKGEIALRMRKKNQNFITEHLALLDAPDCVNQAYADGITSARTLYDLRQAYEAFPEDVAAWCNSGVKITRDTIKALLAQFRHDEKTGDEAGVASPAIVDTSPRVLMFDQHEDALRVLNEHEVKPAPAYDATVLLGVKPDVQVPRPIFRHDEKDGGAAATPPETREFRHDGKKHPESTQQKTPLALHKTHPATDGIMVQYKDKPARIAANTTVTIVVDGQDVPMEVPLSELVFKEVK